MFLYFNKYQKSKICGMRVTKEDEHKKTEQRPTASSKLSESNAAAKHEGVSGRPYRSRTCDPLIKRYKEHVKRDTL
jgi:hypothetical protein